VEKATLSRQRPNLVVRKEMEVLPVSSPGAAALIFRLLGPPRQQAMQTRTVGRNFHEIARRVARVPLIRKPQMVPVGRPDEVKDKTGVRNRGYLSGIGPSALAVKRLVPLL
jgi:hypothetical protein